MTREDAYDALANAVRGSIRNTAPKIIESAKAVVRALTKGERAPQRDELDDAVGTLVELIAVSASSIEDEHVDAVRDRGEDSVFEIVIASSWEAAVLRHEIGMAAIDEVYR